MRAIRRTLHMPHMKKTMLLSGFLAVLLMGAFLLNTLTTARHAHAARIETRTAYESVYISDGDTLWSIAQKYRGSKSTAAFVEDIMILNGLSTDQIRAGYYLVVPVLAITQESTHSSVCPGAVRRARPYGGVHLPEPHSVSG